MGILGSGGTRSCDTAPMEPAPDGVEVVLHGGVANVGAVVRVGDHVLRPSNPHTADIHRFLTDLRDAGFDGVPRPGSKFEVTISDSIENRLIKLLLLLTRTYPGEGWDSYLAGTAPKWESIVVAGHILGATLAAQIARQHAVARVAMLGGPVDHLPVGRQTTDAFQVAAWLQGPHATPSERYYAFGHLADENANWELQWKATKLGLEAFGPIVNVDHEAAPYRNSHLLMTGAAPALAGRIGADDTVTARVGNSCAWAGTLVSDASTPKAATAIERMVMLASMLMFYHATPITRHVCRMLPAGVHLPSPCQGV